jgi:hypothetical protein
LAANANVVAVDETSPPGSAVKGKAHLSTITTKLRQRAAIYRDMARKAFDPKLRLEFADRAERFETVARAMKRQPRG